MYSRFIALLFRDMVAHYGLGDSAEEAAKNCLKEAKLRKAPKDLEVREYRSNLPFAPTDREAQETESDLWFAQDLCIHSVRCERAL